MPRQNIVAEDTWTDWIVWSHYGAMNYQLIFEGDRTNGSTVTVQAKRHLADGAVVVIDTILSSEKPFWLGTAMAPLSIRAGVAAGDFGAGDDFTIDLG